jgi:hypothetical protein
MAFKPRQRGGRRGRAKAVRPASRSPREELRAALEELRDRRERKRGKRRGKQRHVDDYRELVLEASHPGGLSEALLDLTQSTHQNRHRLLGDERPRLELPGGLTGRGGSAEDARRQALRAAREMREEMRKRGVAERAHYYSASERRETGEIERTYKLRPEHKGRRAQKGS